MNAAGLELVRCAAVVALGAVAAFGTAATAVAAEFVDDADRRVELPETPSRVFAAGAPAEILLYTLVPEMLVGRNHTPSPAGAALMPPQFRSLPSITNLPDRDDARYDAEFIALKPDVYVDYGTVDDDYVASLEAVSARTNVPAIILNGSLAEIPEVYRRLGTALGVAERGNRMADTTQRLLAVYRNRLAGAVRVYIACSGDALTPCYEGHSGGEAAQWLGAINVAGALAAAPRRPWTIDEIRAAAPDVIVAFDAARLLDDAAWRVVPAVAAGRVHSPPALPFGWGSRPPSVNRLPGLVWLAHVAPGGELEAEFFADIALLFDELYHVEVGADEIRALVAR
jgi:iron complex transport system substrate-binding protein